MIGAAASGAPATAPAAQADPQQARLREAAEAFEAVFLRQVIGSMRQASLASDIFGSSASDQFRDMADANLADSMAQQGSFGIAELLIQRFSGRVGAAPAATPDGETL